MTLEKSCELIATHFSLGRSCNRNAARTVSVEVVRKHGQQAVDSLIREYGLDKQWKINPGTESESAFKS